MTSPSDLNEPRTCPRCGIFYYEWLHSGFAGMERGDEPLIPNVHECPAPYPPDVARMMLNTCIATGMPVSQRTRARIRLGLEQEDA